MNNNKPGFSNAEKDEKRREGNIQENNKSVKNHQEASVHFSLASKHHQDASRYHHEGDHEKANQSTLLAIGQAALGVECQMQDAKHQAIERS